MATKIEWTDETWNPIVGCTPVSTGCDSCYAGTLAAGRLKHLPLYADLTDNGQFNGTVKTVPERLDDPLHWRKPRRVFVNSMSDLFHQDVPDEFILRVWQTMARTPQHTYQILTKRHARMRSFVRRLAFAGPTREESASGITGRVPYLFEDGDENQRIGAVMPLENVWLGVSAEDQATANLRVPALLETPAAIRFVSAEPLLGPVNLKRLQRRTESVARIDALSGDVWSVKTGEIYAAAPGCIDWVIVGGESGRQARPMHPNWARSLRDQTTNAGRAFLFKQWGEWGPAPWVVRVCDPAVGWQGSDAELAAAKADAEARGASHVYASWAHEYGHGLYEPLAKPWSSERVEPLDAHQAPMRRWGKKHAGRELDGRRWDEYPQAVTT